MPERLLVRIYRDLKAFFESIDVATQAFQQIQKQYFLLSHVIASNSKEIDSLKLQMTYTMLATQAGFHLFAYYVWRPKSIRICFGLGLLVNVMVVRKLYTMYMLESVARTHSEAGEVARATILFKMPEHRHRKEFEKLSKDYADYAADKRKKLGDRSNTK